MMSQSSKHRKEFGAGGPHYLSLTAVAEQYEFEEALTAKVCCWPEERWTSRPITQRAGGPAEVDFVSIPFFHASS